MTAAIYSDFKALHAASPGLSAMPPLPGSIFQTQPWFANLQQHAVSADCRLALLADERGCLPLLDDGHTLSALSNYYSSLFGPLNPSGHLPAGLPQLLRQLGTRTQVMLQPLDREAEYFETLRQALAENGYWVDDFFCFGNWYLQVAGQDFASYLSRRPAQLRNNIQRGGSKLNKAGNWQVSIHQQPGPELEAAIAAFESVYARSWKNIEPHPQFIPALCRMAAEHGWLRLGILSLNDTPIAAQLWLHYQHTSSIYKLAYDEEATRYSAGSILTAAMMEQAIDIDRADEVDYLTGDEPYKQDWMSHRRERHGLVGFRLDTWAGLRAAARHQAGRLLRRLRAQS